MKRTIAMVALLMLSTAASAGVENIKESKKLKPDEGILVTSVTCADRINFVQLYLSGNASTGFWGPYRFDSVATCAKGLKTRPVKAGRYYIGWVGIGQQGVAIAEPQAVSFKIEAGKLNYIGDIYVGDVSPFHLDNETLLRTTGNLVSVVDQEARARAALAADHAWLLSRYEFVSAPAAPPPRVEEGNQHPARP
ncbi:hypothetical protein TEP_08950 [Stenotrophomonas sp. TEPEL]|uniref:hypothetical protein n=1 Tax=Stenotrophomonas sp. TEPEL TaxID=2283801 RepID=UPI00104741F9|nr:hypothetical protein [Stenotrophomonas sp. TEPEL]TDB33773.1 hypothetical protein TEP_08950 [Stenotrophomonas sp. TEPEL]